MENQQIKKFIEQVKLESTYRKIIKSDIIYQLINKFNAAFDKQSYSSEIENHLEIPFNFIKNIMSNIII